MHPYRLKVCTYRRSDGLPTRPDNQNTFISQSTDTNDALRDPLHGPVTDDLADRLKDLTINDAECYVSKPPIENDEKGNPAINHNTVNHTSDGKGKVMNTSNGNSQQKLLSDRTLPVVILTINPRIDNRIAPIEGASQTLFTSVKK